MRRVLAFAGLFAASNLMACPPPPIDLSTRVGEPVVIAGTLHACKLGPCVKAADGELVILRDSDAGRFSGGTVRVEGTLEHDAGSASDDCNGTECEAVASVPAHYFIRAATITAVHGGE